MPAASSAQSRRADECSRRYQRASHVVSRSTPNSTELLDCQSHASYTLNHVGGRIWDLMGTGVTFTEIVERLYDEYQVLPSRIEDDTKALIRRLLALKLITPVLAQ